MQHIYRQSDRQFEVYTTVLSPQVCRSRTRHVESAKVVVAVAPHCPPRPPRPPRELPLQRGDLVQVLSRGEDGWWWGRLQDGAEGFFPSSCVQPLPPPQARGATPTLLRRGSVPVVIATASAPCGCASGSPRLQRPPGPPPHGPPSLLHRVLAKSRRKSCPHLQHPTQDSGSTNSGFQPD